MNHTTKYNDKIVETICNLIETDTYTIVEICNIAKISKATYFRWMNENSNFYDAVKKAEETRKNYVIVEAKKSLLRKVQGYTVQDKHTTYVETSEGRKVKEEKVVEKFVQPDTAAIIFTLTNCDPVNWKNKHSAELTGSDDSPLMPSGITIEIIDKREQVEGFNEQSERLNEIAKALRDDDPL